MRRDGSVFGALILLGFLTAAASSAAQQIDTLTLMEAHDSLPGDGFTAISGVRELRDGRVLVADPQEQRLVVVRFENGSLKSVGRTGDGPREYAFPGGLFPLAGDSTLLTDVGSRRWYLLYGDSIVDMVPLQSPLPDRLGPELLGASAEGRVLGVEGYLGRYLGLEGSRATSDSLRLLLAEHPLSQDTTMEFVTRLGGRGRLGIKSVREGPYVSINPSPLASEDQALLFSDSWIAVVRTDPYRVRWRSPRGHWTEEIQLPESNARVGRAEKCFAIRRVAPTLKGCPIDRYPDFPERLPAFLVSSLHASPEGYLVVERTPSLAFPNYRDYDVINRAGRIVKVVRLPRTQRLVGFGESSVFIASRDSFDVERLVRYPWNGT